MRIYPPLLAMQNLFWERLTLSKLTIGYFIFSLAHAIIQVALQAKALSINANADAFLSNIIQQGDISANGFMVYGGHELRMCTSAPPSLSVASCRMIWDGTPVNDTQFGTTGDANRIGSIDDGSTSTPSAPNPTPSSSSSPSTTSTSPPSTTSTSPPSPTSTSPPSNTSTSSPLSGTSRPVHTSPSAAPPVTPNFQSSSTAGSPGKETWTSFWCLLWRPSLDKRDGVNNSVPTTDISGPIQVQIPGLGFSNNRIVLDLSCVWALNWPLTALRNAERENVVFIAFQLWVLGMSIVALLNHSIPHMLASLLTQMLATVWSGFLIGNNAAFHTNFSRLTTHGTCNPIDLLPKFWKLRTDLLIASFVLNITALVIAAFLSWQLTKGFGWMTFKRIGASMQINRQYTVVLLLSITIQLGLFFVVASISLWIDQLFNGSIGRLTSDRMAERALLIVVLLLLFPWSATGWFSARRELKVPMWIFLGLSCGYLIGWVLMFVSATFRWTFMQWSFFGVMTCVSIFLIVTILFVGVMCLLGFGKGLPRYLNPEEPVIDEDYGPASPVDIEKVDFSLTHEQTSAGFDPRDDQYPYAEAPPDSHYPDSDFSTSLEGSDPQQPVHLSPAVYLRSMSPTSPTSSHSAGSLARTGSVDSQSSYASSVESASVYSSDSRRSYDTEYSYRSGRYARRDRWVIE